MRLDNAIVQRGLVESRTKAQRLIRSGDIRVAGQTVTKVSAQISDSELVVLETQSHFVGRGSLKLLAALDCWKFSVDGRLVLDIGASTGGFTQLLLQRGAKRVVALDVGHGQLHPILRGDPRVLLFEGKNVRNITSNWWAAKIGVSPQLVTCDVSFISLSKVVPSVTAALGRLEWIVLVKPQFESGRKGTKNGVTVDPQSRQDALLGVAEAAAKVGLKTAGLIASPIRGEKGNQEYLLWLSPVEGGSPSKWKNRIHELAFSKLGDIDGRE